MSFSNKLSLNDNQNIFNISHSNVLDTNLQINKTKQEIHNAIENLIDTKLEQKFIDSNINSPNINSPNINSPNINSSNINSPNVNSPNINQKPINYLKYMTPINPLNNNSINTINNLTQKNNTVNYLDTLFQKNNMKNKNLILTHIDLDSDNVKLLIRKYRTDYLEQRLYFDNNFKESAKWSDTPENDSCINDVFAFVNVIQNKVELFRIENILQNYLNVETKNKYELSKDFKLRRTLILSKKIMELTWLDLKEYLNYSYNFTFKGMIKCNRKI